MRVPDYVAIGHLTIDHTPAGDVLGGTVLYAALAAARFGARAAILTRAGVGRFTPAQRAALDDVAAEIEIVVQESDATTTFTNREVGARREQTLHAWAGPMDLTGLPPLWRSAAVVHLAPVAQEIEPRQIGRLASRLVGCTPQGWMRRWDNERMGPVRLSPLRLPRDTVSRIDAVVVSSQEFTGAREVVEEVGRRGLAAVTRGMLGAAITDRGRAFEAAVFRADEVDPIGAGDVFAGILFAARGLGESVIASARYASAAAALKVGGAGLPAVPTRDAIEALVEAAR